MKTETIKENTDYQKIDKAFIINRNNTDYKLALTRRKNSIKQHKLEERLSTLESKIDQIFTLLKAKK